MPQPFIGPVCLGPGSLYWLQQVWSGCPQLRPAWIYVDFGVYVLVFVLVRLNKNWVLVAGRRCVMRMGSREMMIMFIVWLIVLTLVAVGLIAVGGRRINTQNKESKK